MMTMTMLINTKILQEMRSMKRMLKTRKMKILINVSKMKKLLKTRARADFEHNRNDDEY